jgi:succinoglycan biosynthesis transport protein ExoP
MDALTGKRTRFLTDVPEEWPGSEPNQARRSSTSDDAVQTAKQVLDSIRKYKPFIVKMIVAGMLLAVAASILMSPSYTATTQLVVNVRNPGAPDAAGSSGEAPSAGVEESAIDTHITVMLSDAYLLRLLPPLRALDDARYDNTGPTPWVKRVSALFRPAWLKIREWLDITAHPDGEALVALKSRLMIARERRSRIISVSFTDRDPKRAADVANLIARLYVDELARQRQTNEANTLNAVAVVQRELSKIKTELDASRHGQSSPSQIAALEWQMTTLAQQLESLLRRRQEVIAKGLAIESEVTVVANASPPELPTSLNPLFLIPPTAIAFALLACLIAVVRNRFDATLHTESEVVEALGIPCAGLISSIPRGLSRQPLHIPKQSATEYMRSIRSTVVSLLASDSENPQSQQIALVTSSARGEGKTAISWGMCFCAAQLGRRVLLLDLGHLFRRSGDDTSDLFRALTHDQPPALAIQHIEELGIDYLPAGFSEGSRLWMLASAKVSLLLEQLREAYDFVVIDAPALQAAPEVGLLVRWADHVLLAVRAGCTNRELAQSTLHLLARTEHAKVETKFWSVLVRRHRSEHDKLDVKQRRVSDLMTRLLARTEHAKVETKFWSLLARRHRSEHDKPDVKQRRGSELMTRYQRFKEAVRRWKGIGSAVHVSGPAQPNSQTPGSISKRPRNA